ncbi:MAG: hypothetical protein RLZZ584_1318 [Pseudomonadota bacterium]
MSTTSLARSVPAGVAARTRQVAILLFDDIEVLDFAGPYEVFTTASRVHGNWRRAAAAAAGEHQAPPDAECAPFAVCTVAARPGPVRARAGLVVLPDHGLHDHPAPDLLIVPGGVVDAALLDDALVAWITRTAASAEVVASVCTGAFLLGRAGLLHGRSVTTHWEDVGELRARHPGLQVHTDRRWVDEGRVVSSAGISAGLDMSLHLVARLAGAALARATARQMDYEWREAEA